MDSTLMDINDLPIPSYTCTYTLTGLNSNEGILLRFFGFVNYLAKFLPGICDVSEPLRHLTYKDAVWYWEPQHNEAIETIKKLVTDRLVLRYYDVKGEVPMECDAREVVLGAVLLQNGQPLAFASRSLTPIERRYAQI